jgi:hypothetical protein
MKILGVFSHKKHIAPLLTSYYCKTADVFNQVMTKRCRLSWLTNSAQVYEPKCEGGGGGGLRGLSL